MNVDAFFLRTVCSPQDSGRGGPDVVLTSSVVIKVNRTVRLYFPAFTKSQGRMASTSWNYGSVNGRINQDIRENFLKRSEKRPRCCLASCRTTSKSQVPGSLFISDFFQERLHTIKAIARTVSSGFCFCRVFILRSMNINRACFLRSIFRASRHITAPKIN